MIYLLKSYDYLKIGYSSDIDTRLKQYKTYNPNFTLLDTKEGTQKDEKVLHKLCYEWHVGNEWYKDIPEVRNIWNNYNESEEKEIVKLKEKIEQLQSEIHHQKIEYKELQTVSYNFTLFSIKIVKDFLEILCNLPIEEFENNEKAILNIIKDILSKCRFESQTKRIIDEQLSMINVDVLSLIKFIINSISNETISFGIYF